MAHISRTVFSLTNRQARRIWLDAQKLDTTAPFGQGPGAAVAAVEHLGYVQIDTIHVIERCHHHILFTRIPEYRREHLHQAQSVDKTVFEYRAHALAYLPLKDFPFYAAAMRSRWQNRAQSSVKPEELRKVKMYESSNHQRNFIDCVKSRQPTITPVQTAHHSAIPGHLGLISMLTGRKIHWDVASEKILGDPEASKLLTRTYRAPWRIS